MGLYKNVTGQKIAVYAHDTSADAPKTGDAANITAELSKDFGASAALADTNPTELDAADHPGIYVFDLSQAETAADVLVISAVSSTADIALDPVQVFTDDFYKYGVIDSGTAQSATGTTLVLRAAAGFADDELIGATICITGGSTGVGQRKVILDYVSATDTATVSTWTTTPTGTITYKIFGSAAGEGVAQTGDAYAIVNSGTHGNAALKTLIDTIESQTDDIGVAGAGLTALATAANLATVAGYLDTEIAAIKTVTDALPDAGALTSLATAASIAALNDPTVGEISDAVWTETLADHSGVSGSTAEALNAAGAAGDPWTTALPGAYGAGSAGKIIGDNINATIGSRASQASVDTVDDLIDTEVAAALAAVDTEVAAIKAKTDSLTFTVAGQVDANVQAVNDVTLEGDGSATPWGPA